MTEVPLSDLLEYGVYKGDDVKILAREVAPDIYSIKLFYLYDDENEPERDEELEEIPDEEHIVRRSTLMKLFDHYKIPKATEESEWVFEETTECIELPS
jgi:hypothetical protein